MDISVSNYHRDITEKGLRIYLQNDKLGIHNLDNDKKTMPSFDRVVTSDKYVFVEVNNRWGILAMDLSLIASPMYNEIYPIKLTDRKRFISNCQSNQSPVSLTMDSNSSIPTHIAIQKGEIFSHNKYGIDMGDIDLHSMTAYNEAEKANIFEVANRLENIETNLFVTILDDDIQLIDVDKREIKCNTGFRGYEFFPLWHYKDNMFIIRNNNGTYVTSTYKYGRFTKKSLWGEYSDSFEEYGSPKVVLHRGEFISVCYPETYRFVGSPFANQEKEKEFNKKRGKWALFKYHHKKIEENDKECHKHFSNENTCFEQLTSFVFEEYATQLQNDNEFIFHGDNMDFLMRFEQKVEESREPLEVDKKYEPISCSCGQLNILACFDTIEQREDGLFDISTADGYGLCDINMQIIVPSNYDYPIEWGNQLVIVSKNGKYGVINQKAEEVVPCCYAYIKIGKDEIPIWERECEWNDLLGQSESKWLISTRNDIKSSDVDLMKEGYIIIGVIPRIPRIEKAGNITILDKLKILVAKTNNNVVSTTPCDIYLPNGKFVANCRVSVQGGFEFDKETGTLMVFDTFNSNNLKRYGIYVETSSCPVCFSSELTGDIYSLNGNLYEGYFNLEKLQITKDVCEVKWNGLGRCNFKAFEVSQDNKVFQAIDGVLYTKKGYDRSGKTNKKHIIEIVACPTNVKTHNVMSGTTRIANCAFKGSLIETLNLPDTLEEIGVNAFYMTPNLKHLKLPLSIRKIESQDVGMSGDASPSIEYNGQNFTNWEALYEYMLRNGFEKKNGNIVKKK